jgi:hypothetical protein
MNKTMNRCLFGSLTLLCLIGCARTSIETPDGFRYLGEKNVSIDKMHVRKWHANGQPALDFEAEGISSDPTAVNNGTVQAILGTVGKAIDKVPGVAGTPPVAH